MRTNNASLTLIFTAVVFTGLLTVTSFKVVKAQGSASKGDPVKELVESMRSANFTDVNTEPSLVWKYGETTDAQDYSNDHDVIAFICSIGADAPFKDKLIDIHEGWGELQTWRVIKTHSVEITNGYFLNAVDMQRTPEGAQMQPENKRILIQLFGRTLFM